MKDRLLKWTAGAVTGLTLSLGVAAQAPAPGGAGPAMPRTPDGKPDLSGIWQAFTTASWDIQDHPGDLNTPPGQGIVEGNEIPYQPAALAKKKENYANRGTADLTQSSCFMPGVPRATYMPFPFEIVQTPQAIGIIYEFDHADRSILMDATPYPTQWPNFMMGASRGKWEGDTLVVDVRMLDERTWFDHAGNFHSDALHVTERYTPIDRDHIHYEATIEDPKVFTRPWKISVPLYRRIEKNVRILEYECVWYLQEEKYKGKVPAAGFTGSPVEGGAR